MEKKTEETNKQKRVRFSWPPPFPVGSRHGDPGILLAVPCDGLQRGQKLLVAGHLRGDHAELGPVVSL